MMRLWTHNPYVLPDFRSGRLYLRHVRISSWQNDSSYKPTMHLQLDAVGLSSITC